MKAMRILIVEDSPTDRQLLRYLLEERFHNEAKFREAGNLETAFRYLEMGNIDCVVLDLQLPDSAGRETFQKINERHPYVPIIVMTHNKDRVLALDMIKEGAADYILKDFTNEEDIFQRIVFSIEKHRRSIRMAPDKVATVHQLEKAQANMLTAHQSGQHAAIQSSTVETTSAVAEIAKKMFTEFQSLSLTLSQNTTHMAHTAKAVESLETELLKGNGARSSMRSQVDLLEHRVGQVERRLSDMNDLVKTSEETQRLSAVQDRHLIISTRTKILLGILTLLGVLATALASYEAGKNPDRPDMTPKGR